MREDDRPNPHEQFLGRPETHPNSSCSRYEKLNDMKSCQMQSHPDPIMVKIKAVWGRLTDYEIALYLTDREQFFAKLQEKYGLSHEQAEEKIWMIEASCSAGPKMVLPAT